LLRPQQRDLSSTRLLARTSAWRFNPAHVPCRTPQLPNFEEIWWVSAIGAATSLCYCTIALILGCVYAGNGYGSVGGLPGSSTADKVFELMLHLAKQQGTAFVVVTHDETLAARCDRQMRLVAGSLQP
jgi:hypothetical protein